MKHMKLKLVTAIGCAVMTTAALAHDPGSAGPGTPTCIESNLMVADAQNTPFASAFGPGRVVEINTTTGERGLTVGNPFTGIAVPPVCPAHVSCPGAFKPTGVLSGGEDGHAYLTSAAQHAMVEHHRNATAIRTSPVWPTSPSPNGGGFGFVPRLLGTSFMPNGNIAQAVCDANFFNASNSDVAPEGGLEANHYFPPVNSTAARASNGRVLVIDQTTLEVVDEYHMPIEGEFANDPRWNCPAGVIFTSEGMFVSMFHGDAVFVIDWKAGIIEGRSSGTGSNSTDGEGGNLGNNGGGGGQGNGGGGNEGKAFALDDHSENQAQVIRVIDMSNDGTTDTGYALNYDDSGTGYDSGHRRDNLRAIRMSEDGHLFGTRRSRSTECLRDAPGCNPGVFRQHVFVSEPGSSTRSGSIGLDPGVNILAGVTINRMSGPGCKHITGLDPTLVVGDDCGVETLYVGVSAGNAGCVPTGHPANDCFKPGGTVYEYLIDEAHWDSTTGTCTGVPGGNNTGCAQPIAQFEITDVPGGTVQKIDPRMVMTVHEAFIQ
jgi:hypothetical protein